MATYSIEMMKRDLLGEYRFLKELEDAFRILVDLGYGSSKDPEDRAKYRELSAKVGDQKQRIDKLESLMQR